MRKLGKYMDRNNLETILRAESKEYNSRTNFESFLRKCARKISLSNWRQLHDNYFFRYHEVTAILKVAL